MSNHLSHALVRHEPTKECPTSELHPVTSCPHITIYTGHPPTEEEWKDLGRADDEHMG